MKNNTNIKPKKSLFKRILLLSSVTTLLVILTIILYGLYLSYGIQKRFASRRWSIPSTVYSDILILYPGQRLNMKLFREKLEFLGYRQVPYLPKLKGEMRFIGAKLELFLNDLSIPTLQRDGFSVEIGFKMNEIVSIARRDTSEILPILEIEPEKLMMFFGSEREMRELVSINEIPEYMLYAVMAAEDADFYHHIGIDPAGIVRALLVNLRHGKIRQGGSTLTQQLAKNYFLTHERTITRKVKEICISLILEVMYAKKEILEIYLNEIYFGQKGSVSINGIGEAARFYFGKSVKHLSAAESAVIAGLIKAPNLYSPYKSKARCKKRRDIVLNAMHKNGWLSDDHLKEALKELIIPAGYKAYGKRAPYFMDYVTKQLNELYSKDVLSGDGLSIYTTLDTQLQSAVEQALESGLQRLENTNPALKHEKTENKLQGAVVVMQPKTGNILAMAGGRSYGESQYNRVVQSQRQPGSAIKPFVYLGALDAFSPSDLFSNGPQSIPTEDGIWEPKNFEKVPDEPVTMRTALSKSYNLATIDLAMKVGMEHVMHTISAFQFSTPMAPYPSLALGAFEVIPLELARAYCVFAADGVLPYPMSLKEVIDDKGILLENRHMKITQVTSPARAFMVSSLLKSVIEDGTGKSVKAYGVTWPAAGKTGTTNNYRDAWFVGFTPDLLTLVWVGFDNGNSIFTTGAGAALPIWAEVMRAGAHLNSKRWLRVPPGVVQVTICKGSGALAIPKRCPDVTEEYFLKEFVPTQKCPIHAGRLRRFLNKMFKK